MLDDLSVPCPEEVDDRPAALARRIDDGDVLTSAGAASGLDICLHIIRKDHGSEVANRVARMCVVPPWHDGGQAQYIEYPVDEIAGQVGFAGGTSLREHLHAAIGVSPLAYRRTFRGALSPNLPGTTAHTALRTR